MKRAKAIKAIAIALCAALGFSIAGCSSEDPGQSNSGAANSSSNNEKLTINYFSSRDPSGAVCSSLKDIVELYNQEGGNAEIKIENVTDRASYLQKVKILASSNELADWFDADSEPYFASLCDSGIIANIGDLYDELDIKDKFFPMTLQYPLLDDGSLYLMNWEGNVEYFWYNTKIFEEAGITKTPETFDELMADCDILLEKGITPIALGNFDMVMRYPAMMAFRKVGNDFIDKARLGEESFTSEVGLESAQFFVDMVPYFSKGWNASDATTQNNLFVSGEAAMLYDGTWDTKTFTDENMELLPDIDIFPLPAVDPDTDATGANDYWAHSGMGTAVLKESMTDEMKKFIDFMWDHYADISMYDYNTVPSLPPTIRDDLPEIYQRYIEDLGNVKTFAKCWDVRLDASTNEVYRRELANLGLGEITPQEFGERMDAAVAENAPNYFDID